MPGTAVYAGSFDPPTNGHLWMIEQGARLFDKLIVAVGANPAKRPAYTVEQRLAWLRTIASPHRNVEIASFGNLFLAHFAAQVGASFMLRGIRSEPDFAYEQTMRHINADLAPAITTVFLMPPREIAEVSSSLVRGIIGPQGWQAMVKQYVPACVFQTLVAGHA